MMNKKRLAALALSAVMTTSTMSIPVYAADFSDGADIVTQEVAPQAETSSTDAEAQSVEVTDETPDAAGDVGEAYVVDPNSIQFHYNSDAYADFTVTFQRVPVDGTGEPQSDTATATTLKHLDANCYHPGLLWMTVTIDGQTYTSGDVNNLDAAFKVPTEPQREHKKHEVKRQTIKPATHFEKGQAHVWYDCEYEDCEWTDEEFIDLEVQDHEWGDWVYVAGDNVKADENGYVVFDENGDPELIDELKDGLYYQTRFCTVDNAEDTANRKELRAYAKKAAYAEIIDQEGIATDLVGQRYDYPTADLPIDEATIELEDCSEEGWYIVEYYTIENKPISQEKIKVAPHHFNTYATAEFKTLDDKSQCKVEWNGKELKVTNTSCYLPIEYDEVIHCSAAGCNGKVHDVDYEAPQFCEGDKEISRETKTAEPTGAHVIKTSALREVEALVARGKVLYSELKAIADVEDNFVQISARPENNCEEAGKVTVKFICVVDKKEVVKEMTVDVIASGHTRQPAERENYVAPTCTATGSYDAVIYCKTCGKELERREDVIIPRIKHTNEVNVAPNGIGEDDVYADATAYIGFVGDKVVDYDGENLANYEADPGKVYNTNSIGTNGKNEYTMYAYVYTNCTVCGKHEVKLADSRQDLVEITIVDIKKQEENGKAGYITLKATYDQNDVVGGTVTKEITVPYFSTIEAYQGRLEEAPLNGLHWDEDGQCRYYVDGVFQKDFSGILQYAGSSFVIKSGVLCKDASGLNLIDDQWYFLTEGRIRTDVTQVVLYDGEWFYVSNGRLDTNVNGLVPYDGETFVFVEGRLAQEGNGLWVGEEGVWYFLSDGRVAKEHTGLAMYDNEWFYIVNGKLAVDYSGTVEYNGATFKVDHGMVRGQVK